MKLAASVTTASLVMSALSMGVASGASASDDRYLCSMGGPAITYHIDAQGKLDNDNNCINDAVVKSVPGNGSNGSGVFVKIFGDTASHSYQFSYDLPSDVTLVPADGGSIVFERSDGAVLGGVDPAWAKDAKGAAVPTHYSISGHTITQTIDFSANTAFPITADPWWNPFSWNWHKIGHIAVANLKKCGAGALGGVTGLGGGTVTANIIRNAAGKTLIKVAGGPYGYVAAGVAGCVQKYF